jgi:serine/threonine-protein kinase RsbW
VAFEIRVTIPARSRFLRIARLTAAGVASDLGFDLRDLEDLRVAVDEMCAVVIEAAEPGVELELLYRAEGDSLVIEGTCAQDGEAADIHPIARELLTLTADEFHVEADGTTRHFRLVKRQTDRSV